MASKNKAEIRRGVHSRIRKKVSGTAERPRLAVFRSLNHIYAQVINDDNGTTLAAASTTEKDLGIKTGGNLDAAQTIGKTIAERALAAGVSQVVFDRGGYLYHGRVKALLDATRESGLNKNESAGSGESSTGESDNGGSIADSVSGAIKSVAGAISGVLDSLTGGDAAAENENAPKAKKKVEKENNENQ